MLFSDTHSSGLLVFLSNKPNTTLVVSVIVKSMKKLISFAKKSDIKLGRMHYCLVKCNAILIVKLERIPRKQYYTM